MRTLLVSNAAAGGSDQDVLERVKERLQDLGEVDLLAPDQETDGDTALRERAGDSDLVVIAGGDGSLNAAVNALNTRLDDVVVGLVPMGTGNDFARTLALPEDPVEAAAALVGGAEKTVDVARVSGAGCERWFANACMGGFPVEVNRAIDEDAKRRFGPLAFWWGGAKAAADITRYAVTVDGTTKDDCIAAGVGNGRTAGGGIEVFPSAQLDDGELDCCIIQASNLIEGLRAGARIRKGEAGENDLLTRARASSIRIESEPPMEFNVDGDLVGLRTPVAFEVAGKMRMMLPS